MMNNNRTKSHELLLSYHNEVGKFLERLEQERLEQEQPTGTLIQEQQPTGTLTHDKLTQEQLRQEIHYDPETGTFRKMVRFGEVLEPSFRIGKVKSSSGYLQIRINGVVHQAHRMAWLYMTGVMPDFHIIHIDGVKHNNRWANLERRTSIRVDKKVGSEQASGVMGVTWDKPRNQWRVRTRVNGKSKHVGMFKELNDAIEARENANTRYEQKP
jgi:hypothetical protein